MVSVGKIKQIVKVLKGWQGSRFVPPALQDPRQHIHYKARFLFVKW